MALLLFLLLLLLLLMRRKTKACKGTSHAVVAAEVAARGAAVAVRAVVSVRRSFQEKLVQEKKK